MPASIRTIRSLALALVLLAPFAASASAAAAPARPADPAGDCALAGGTGWTDEGHDTDQSLFQRPVGKIRVGMLFVDFPDAPAVGEPSEYRDFLQPAARWLSDASYGTTRLDIEPVGGWLRMPQPSTDYGFDRGITFEQHELYVRQAVAAAGRKANLARFDMLYIVPTKSAAAIKFSPTYIADPATDGVIVNGKRLKWAVTFGQDMYRWGFKVANHETGHTFGLPDLYAFSGGDVHPYVGGWDVMGNIAGRSPQQLAWESWKMRWISDRQVACLAAPGSRSVRLKAVEVPGGTKMAVIRTGPTTAYVAESRRATGLDPNPCSTGVLIYRVDSAVQTGEGPVRVQDARPATEPPTGCGPLDDAAYRPGETFDDPATGVRIRVDSGDTLTDTISITKRS
ncbi:peptidase M6 [Embleya sp. NBC_00896]|uniref:peptidase M6 n=1 Tax=Embleya sp. NBC_00896 TaxID=2975961 RepID=UPI002F9124F1|nr:peptidase M6 [Embleya sp. NBC_00896]